MDNTIITHSNIWDSPLLVIFPKVASFLETPQIHRLRPPLRLSGPKSVYSKQPILGIMQDFFLNVPLFCIFRIYRTIICHAYICIILCVLPVDISGYLRSATLWWQKCILSRWRFSMHYNNNNFYLYSAIKSNQSNCSVALYKSEIKINVRSCKNKK